jgi:hypothetical protein
MQLKEFVQQTINEIAEGLQSSNRYLAQMGSRIDDSGVTTIDFDIAVLSEDQLASKTGAHLTVASVLSAGHKMENENRTQNTNRVKFSVMVHIKTNNNGWGAA